MDTPVDISANPVAWGWQDPAEFVRDLKDYKATAGVFWKYKMENLTEDQYKEIEKEYQQRETTLQHQTKQLLNPELNPIHVTGSNANWGRITQPDEIQGTTLEELGIQDIKTPQRCAEFYQDINDYLFRHQTYAQLSEEGELIAPILKAIEEENDTELAASNWLCKGCSKYFATKASLKRHHDRKKSCKDLCEKLVEPPHEVPDKPYIVDWIDQLQTKAISGDSEKPYCKHCDVEFANKSNLNKHLSKSVACDKLAKQDFLKLLS